MTTRILMWLAAVAYLVSWFLPATDAVLGWEAFRYALSPLVPFRQLGPLGEHAIPAVLSALTNVMFLVLLGLWFTRQMFRPGMFVRIAIACFVLNLYWLAQAWRDHDLASLRAGYFLWLAAFGMLLAVAIVTAFEARRTSRIPTAGTPS
jgi:hypothetical protein